MKYAAYAAVGMIGFFVGKGRLNTETVVKWSIAGAGLYIGARTLKIL